ncbi:hypothetical protein GYMLUDRAFT_238955 [Collybiopsis luxurians FD-317 M1]|nr:hypothetical protein GYMLUDRAFT_238955 [Collybiopsis luxurians FD-317 M1]
MPEKLHPGLRKVLVHLSTDSSSNARRTRSSKTTIIQPSNMQRLKESQRVQEVHVLNVEPIVGEDEPFYDLSLFNTQQPWVIPMPSNGGGEWEDIEDSGFQRECQEVYEDIWNGIRRSYRYDDRNRSDRIECLVLHWLSQYDEMVNGYQDWVYNEELQFCMPESIEGCTSLTVLVTDVFTTSIKQIPLPGDTYESTSMICAGVFLSSPLQHNTGFSTRVLELYHNLST